MPETSPGMTTERANYTFTGASVSKCPRRCNQVNSIRLGIATSTQIAKNSGHPVALAMNPAPEDK